MRYWVLISIFVIVCLSLLYRFNEVLLFSTFWGVDIFRKLLFKSRHFIESLNLIN